MLDDLTCASADFELMWVALRPRLLPRPISIILLGIVYCPPWYGTDLRRSLSRYIVSCVYELNRKFTNAVIILTGDFNALETSLFNKYLHFKQVVTKCTRGLNILDKIFTNVSDYYSEPVIWPPLGKSDHNCVYLNSVGQIRPVTGHKIVSVRLLSDLALSNMADDLTRFNWSCLYRMDDCQLQADLFYSVLFEIVDRNAPIRHLRLKNSDRPWVTAVFKNLIEQRNYAFRIGDTALYKCLRNKVNRLRKSLQRRYFNERVQQLKKINPSRWWKEIKLLGGVKQNSCIIAENIFLGGRAIAVTDLPSVINNYFVSVSSSVQALDSDCLNRLRSELPEVPDEFVISEMSTYYALKNLKTSKASFSDDITNRLLNELADVLAGPICSLINTSIRQGVVPHQWKVSRISPIPKTMPVHNIESDLRPIAITCPISKVAETFISQFFNDHFDTLLDENQFGSTRNRSTTLALIKFANFLFESSDDCQNFIRILFIDFSQAFDRINHNVLCDKLTDCNFPPHIVLWSLSFLHDRMQFVKVGKSASTILCL